MNILIVESSRLYQTMISRALKKEEFFVHIATSYSDALKALEHNTFDYVCAAYHLPDGYDGIKLAQQIRTTPGTKHVPVILLTSDDIDQSFEYAYHSGVTEIYNRSDISILITNIKNSFQAKQNEINATALYIEDCKTDAALIKQKLNAINVSVEHFVNAAEALQSFKLSPAKYDIIITALLVEGHISGMRFIREVRKIIPDRSKMPILVTSGLNDRSRRVELLIMGANEFISKPVAMEEFAAQITNLVTVKQSFDQIKSQHEQLFKLAMTDQLTGLYNRHSLVKLLPQYLNRSIRELSPLSLLVVDIDHFKHINDTYGHSKGDDVIRQLAKLLSETFRCEDLIVRYGGEEFIILMGNTGEQEALLKANTLRARIEGSFIQGVKITVSIGVASATHNANFQTLFNQADEALYHAKENGRNCTFTYPLKLNTA